MLVAENPAAVHNLLERIRNVPTTREAGLHVSGLIYCARKAWVRYHHPELPSTETDDDTLIFLLGKGHHTILEGGNGLGEIKTILYLPDDVHGTIDSMEGIPVEFKTTRSSSRRNILEHQNYINQLGAYCAAVGSLVGRLYVLYICGNYKPPKPEMCCYDFSFDTKELETYRELLVQRVKIIKGDTVPPLDMHFTFECDRCSVKELIGCPGGKGSYDAGFFHTTTPPWEIQGWPKLDKEGE